MGFHWNNGFLECNCGGRGCGNCQPRFPAQPCDSPFPPNSSCGCPISLDSNCVIYHKYNNMISGLVNLKLGNGSTLQLILDSIDVQIGYLNAANWALPNLRADGFTINTLPQFGAAVDTELGLIATEITVLQGLVNVPITAIDTDSIDFTLGGTLGHIISANVNISATSGNTLVVLGDGLYAGPQTLSINYINKTLSISDGNTVDFSSLLCQAGWQGDVVTDPVGLGDGNYWFNTTSGQLKMRLNGATRVITIT
jgi:hypothetical protein